LFYLSLQKYIALLPTIFLINKENKPEFRDNIDLPVTVNGKMNIGTKNNKFGAL
jgi:hypothetical protein